MSRVMFSPHTVRSMLMLLLMAVLVPVLLVQAAIYYRWFAARQATEFQANLELARSAGITLGTYVDDVLHQEMAVGTAITLLQPFSSEQASRILADNAREYPSLFYYSWLAPDGHIIASSSSDLLGLDVRDRSYYQDIMSGKESVISDLYMGRVAQQPVFAIARAVHDGSGSLVGMVVASVNAAGLGQVLEVDSAGEGAVSLFDRTGRLVYRYPELKLSWDERDWTRTDPSIARALAGEEVQRTFATIAGEERMGARVPVRSLGWAAAADRSVGAVMTPLVLDSLTEGSAMLATVLVALLFALLISRRVTAPMARLREHALSVGRGELSRPAVSEGPLEMRELAAAFNRMAEEIQLREDQREKSMVEQRRLAHHLRLLLESTDQGIYGIDLEGRCSFANLSAARMLGYRPEEMLGKNMHRLIHHSRPDATAYPPEECPIFLAFMVGRGARVANEVFWRKDGSSFPVEYSSYPIVQDGVVQGAVVAFFDITERKLAESRIQELNRDLMQRAAELAASNKELEAFSYSVAHDLRSPLRSIDGFSQALMEDYANRLDEDGRDHLKRVRGAAQKMARLIDDLLRLSRLTRVEMHRESVDLSEMAECVLADLAEKDPERDVELSVQPGVTAEGDPQLLRLALENLLGNAWKFTGKHDRARIEFGSTRQDGQHLFFVRDDGAGFDMAYADKLFGAFQRLHGTVEFPGTGIGLALVQRVIHRHGGRIWAEGQVERGATFYFTLPDAPQNS